VCTTQCSRATKRWSLLNCAAQPSGHSRYSLSFGCNLPVDWPRTVRAQTSTPVISPVSGTALAEVAAVAAGGVDVDVVAGAMVVAVDMQPAAPGAAHHAEPEEQQHGADQDDRPQGGVGREAVPPAPGEEQNRHGRRQAARYEVQVQVDRRGGYSSDRPTPEQAKQVQCSRASRAHAHERRRPDDAKQGRPVHRGRSRAVYP